jgi:AraC-like DNA-binding protein
LSTATHLRIEEASLPPGREWTDEMAAWRFLRVTSGAGYWLGTTKRRALNEGEMLVVWPGVKAVIRASQLNQMVLHGFPFVPDLICGFFTLPERRLLEHRAGQVEDLVQFLPSTHPLNREFAGLARQTNRAQRLQLRVGMLGIVAAFFSDPRGGDDPSPVAPNSAHARFEDIIGRIPDIEFIQHSPRDLARLCGCSPRHFNRLFQEHFGESPRSRQAGLRLLKARELLANSERRIMQVALDSGYRSMSLFNRLFKRQFGMSPSAWRGKARGGRESLFSDSLASEVTHSTRQRHANLTSTWLSGSESSPGT